MTGDRACLGAVSFFSFSRKDSAYSELIFPFDDMVVVSRCCEGVSASSDEVRMLGSVYVAFRNM